MDHSQPYSDTDPRAMEVWLDLQRRMPAGDKIAAVLAASQFVLQMYEAGVRGQYPHATEREIFLRTAARHLSRDLMIRAYGWDPDGMKSPADAFRRILEVFDRLEIAYLVGGSVASAVHGISRPTMDVDFVAAIREEHVEEFAAELKADFYADPEMMRDSIRSGRPFNLIHFDSAFKYDVFPLPSDPYSRTELARRRFEKTWSIGEEPIECAVATAEDTILTKLRWYRAGGETSERQWNDLRGILKVSGAALDAAYLKQWAPQLGVDDLLDKLLEEP